jgi:predicted homoserine dehydrogenase-like protein
MGRCYALQVVNYTQVMKLVAIANLHITRAARAHSEAGASDVKTVETVSQLERSIQ